MNRPQGDQAMRPMVPSCPRQMARSFIPGTGSSPTATPSAESTLGFRERVAFFFRDAFFGVDFFAAAFFRTAFFFAMIQSPPKM